MPKDFRKALPLPKGMTPKTTSFCRPASKIPWRASAIVPSPPMATMTPESAEAATEIADDLFAHATTALKHALLGNPEPVIAFVDGPLRSYLWHDPEFPWWVAGWLTLVHEHDRAYTWLERWLDRGAINYPILASLDPFFEPLRGELRFQRLAHQAALSADLLFLIG